MPNETEASAVMCYFFPLPFYNDVPISRLPSASLYQIISLRDVYPRIRVVRLRKLRCNARRQRLRSASRCGILPHTRIPLVVVLSGITYVGVRLLTHFRLTIYNIVAKSRNSQIYGILLQNGPKICLHHKALTSHHPVSAMKSVSCSAS